MPNIETDSLKGTLATPTPGGLAGVGFTTVTVNGTSPQTIAMPAYNAGDIVLFGLLTVGGTVSAAGPAVLTGTTGTGFTVGATASDTSTYNVWVLRGATLAS